MAAPKKQTKVRQKDVSSDEQVKDLSLYFVQGREMRLEGLDWLTYLHDLATLSNEQKLERVDQLARRFRVPKVSLKTIKFDPENEKIETKHVDVPLRQQADGIYTLLVPDLYPHDGPKQFEVCGTLHTALPFTKAQHDKWVAFHEAHDLNAKFNKINDLIIKIGENVPTSEEVSAMRESLPKLEATLKSLIGREAEVYGNLDATDDDITKIKARVKLTYDRVAEMKDALKKWTSDNNPFEEEKAKNPLGKELDKVNEEYEEGFLEFVHQMSLEQGLTQEAFELWRENATRDDLGNARELVSEGNASWTRGLKAVPLSREELQRRELQKLLN